MKTRDSFWTGSGLIVLAAICFGGHSSLVKQLLILGSNPFQILFYELALASMILGVARIFYGTRLIGLSGREAGRVFWWGGIGVVGTGLALYAAVDRIPVALAIVLLFYYVPWVFLLEFLVLKIRPTPKRWIALTMILTGTVFATDVTGVSWQTLDAVGILLGLVSGVCYGTFIFGARGLGTMGTPLDRSFLICGLGCVLFIIGGLFRPQTMFVPPEALLQFAVLVAIVTLLGQVIPLLAFSKAIPIVGGSLSAIIASVELPVACLVAFLLLGEGLAPHQWLGVFLITLAVVVANWNRRELRRVPVPGREET